MKKNIYINRISKEIRYKISLIFKKYINDIRIKDITILNIDISNDFSIMKIFIIFSEKDKYKIFKKMRILNNTKSFIKKNIIKTTNIKKVPNIIFIYDDSIEDSINICNLIKLGLLKINNNEDK